MLIASGSKRMKNVGSVPSSSSTLKHMIILLWNGKYFITLGPIVRLTAVISPRTLPRFTTITVLHTISPITYRAHVDKRTGRGRQKTGKTENEGGGAMVKCSFRQCGLEFRDRTIAPVFWFLIPDTSLLGAHMKGSS